MPVTVTPGDDSRPGEYRVAGHGRTTSTPASDGGDTCYWHNLGTVGLGRWMMWCSPDSGP